MVHVRQVALRGGFGEQANKFQTDSSEGEDEGGAVTGVLNAQIVHWTLNVLVQHKTCKQHIEPKHSVVQSEPGPGLGASGQVGQSLRRW